jgi:hypothetical protein
VTAAGAHAQFKTGLLAADEHDTTGVDDIRNIDLGKTNISDQSRGD